MMQGADAELIGYLADYHDQARLVLRDVSDTGAALAALEKAAAAVWGLPHPDEPDCALPNRCEAALTWARERSRLTTRSRAAPRTGARVGPA